MPGTIRLTARASGSDAPLAHLWRVVSFNEEETARIDAHCQRLNAGFRRSHFYLAASIRALHAVASARGTPATPLEVIIRVASIASWVPSDISM